MMNVYVLLDLLIDIRTEDLNNRVRAYEQQGYKVETKQQASGLWSLAAAKAS
jgi:hypothetical protein